MKPESISHVTDTYQHTHDFTDDNSDANEVGH